MAVAITQEKPAEARPFLKEHPFPFPVLHDAGGKASDAYGVSGIPVTALVDREGKLVARLEGFSEEGFETEIAQRVERMMAQ